MAWCSRRQELWDSFPLLPEALASDGLLLPPQETVGQPPVHGAICGLGGAGSYLGPALGPWINWWRFQKRKTCFLEWLLLRPESSPAAVQYLILKLNPWALPSSGQFSMLWVHENQMYGPNQRDFTQIPSSFSLATPNSQTFLCISWALKCRRPAGLR